MAAPTVKEFIRARIYDPTKVVFTDAELQASMDLYKTRLLYVYMTCDDNLRRFWVPKIQFLENATLWDDCIEDNTPTEYEPDTTNLIEGIFEFTNPVRIGLYLKADAYNAYAVISELWLAIASTKYDLYSNMVGATQETLNQIPAQALKQHDYYKKLAFPPKSGRIKRRYV